MNFEQHGRGLSRLANGIPAVQIPRIGLAPDFSEIVALPDPWSNPPQKGDGPYAIRR